MRPWLRASLLPLLLAGLVAPTCFAQGLVGRWQRPGLTVDLRADGTYTWSAPPQTLEGRVLVEGGVIRFLVSDPQVAPAGFTDYRYMVAGDALRLGDAAGQVTDFVRVPLPGKGESLPSARSASPPPAPPAPSGGGLPGPEAPGREATRHLLALVEGYPQLEPDQVARAYARLDPTSLLSLQVYTQLHVDLVRRACQGSLAGQVGYRDPGGAVQSCAQLAREEAETRALGASLGTDFAAGFRREVASQREALALSLRCTLGLTAREACAAHMAESQARHAGNQAVFQGMQRVNQMSHDTSRIIIDNMGEVNHLEWKQVPGN